MDLTIWLLVLAGIIAGVVFVRSAKWFGRRAARRAFEAEERRKAEAKALEQDQQIRLITEWGDKIVAAGKNYDKIMGVGGPPDGAMKYFQKIKYGTSFARDTAYDIYRDVCEWPHRRLELLNNFESSDPFDGLSAIESIAEGIFSRTPSAVYVFGEAADRTFLQERYDEKLRELVSRIGEAERGEAKRTFKKLSKKLERQRSRRIFEGLFESMYSDYEGLLKVNLPDEWNDLVAKFIRTPALDDFSTTAGSMSEAEVLQVATQATLERSLTKAKLSLAYAAVERRHGGGRGHRSLIRLPYREMLGDELVGKLALLVEELHAEQDLFAAGSTKK